jgi:hypothetical protein
MLRYRIESISYWIDIECYNLRYRCLSDFERSISNAKHSIWSCNIVSQYRRSFADLRYRRFHLQYRDMTISKVRPSISKVDDIMVNITTKLDHKWFLLDHKKPILYVIPVESILDKLPVVHVGDTGTIPHRLRNHFSRAPGDSRPGSGDGCRMWFVNSWAFGWSRDM